MSLPDAQDKAIIAELQRDGRAPYSAIAETVGLSETAVRNRVKRLTDSGVVQIVAVTDPTQLGFARQAMIGIRAKPSCVGSVTATIWTTPESVSRLTRLRTAVSLSPTVSAIVE